MTGHEWESLAYGEATYRWIIENDWPHEQRAAAGMVALLGVPESYLDVGCGAGAAVEFMGRVCTESLGVDLDLDGLIAAHDGQLVRSSDREMAYFRRVENAALMPMDLRQPFEVTGFRYDIVSCWEVAEHLPPESADTIVESCVRHVAPGGWLVWTAAQPNQPSDIHINLRPKAYWREKINAAGLAYDDEKTRFLASVWDHTVNPLLHLGWNVLVFRRPE